jgi:ferric hydroxamate transport system substrate-binding protein
VIGVQPPARTQMTRRQFAAALSLLSIAPAARAENSGPRLAVLDWALAETVLALGIAPMGIAEAPLYRDRVVSPELPSGVLDLGLRSWPNMERLADLKPELIIALAGYGLSPARLEAIAPTLSLPIYTNDRTPLSFAKQAMDAIAERTGRQDAARRYHAEWQASLDVIRAALPRDNRPLLIVKFADARLVDIYGPGSLFHDVLTQLGLSNAWPGSTNAWGFATAGLEAIARHNEARLVIIEPGPPEVLANSALWNALPVVRAGRVTTLLPTWVFGALPSALRFAQLLGQRLQKP